MVHMYKMMIYPRVFSFFFKAWFFGLKLPKMKYNNYIRHVPYLRNSIAHNHDFWYTCVKWSKNDRKWQKIVSAVLFISQEPYIIWFSFITHLWFLFHDSSWSFHESYFCRKLIFHKSHRANRTKDHGLKTCK